MLVWFAVMSVLLVAVVFRSAGLDYRTVIGGALLPLVEAGLGGPRLLHSVLGSAGLLVVVMAVTGQHRRVRRRLLGVPIGLLCHLLLDGSFTRTTAFWWPIAGTAFASGQIPEVAHLGVSLALEVAGLAVGVWAWGAFGLRDVGARRRFLRDGRLELLTPA